MEMMSARQGAKQIPKVLLLCMIVYSVCNMGKFTKPTQSGEVFYQTYEALSAALPPVGGLIGKRRGENGTTASSYEQQQRANEGSLEGGSEQGKKKKKRRKKKRKGEEGATATSSGAPPSPIPLSEEEGQPAEQQAPPPPPPPTTSYPDECIWSFDKDKGGYPQVAFQEDRLGDMVCPSMFRDLSDYVFGWPFSHFGEDVYVMDRGHVRDSLPPVPIIYSHVDHLRKGELVTWLRGKLKRPYILITGQSDWAIPSSTENAEKVLRDPNLVRWFAQNNDEAHDKITPIPIGLNCFEHAPEMTQAMDLIGPAPEKTDLLLVNFGSSHPDRAKVWKFFCEPEDPSKQFATCLTKSRPNNIKGNPHLVQFYQDFSSFSYVVCPRGNGMDTHRVWEALYLGVVPILLHSSLDALYDGLPILYVDKYEDVTPDLLKREYPRLAKMMRAEEGEGEGWGAEKRQLHRQYWWELIEGVRAEAMQANNVTEVSPRKRCWGSK